MAHRVRIGVNKKFTLTNAALSDVFWGGGGVLMSPEVQPLIDECTLTAARLGLPFQRVWGTAIDFSAPIFVKIAGANKTGAGTFNTVTVALGS